MAKFKFSKKDKAPLGVKIISILYYFGALMLVILGILLLMGAKNAKMLNQIPFLSNVGTGMFLGMGLSVIILAVLSFFIGMSLWKLHNWARIVTIVLSSLSILSSLFSIVQNGIARSLISIIINGAIVCYLVMSKEVKTAFK